MVDLFKKKAKSNPSQAQTPSDENANMLPNNKKSKSELATKKTNTILLFIAFIMLGIFLVGTIFTANQNQQNIENIEKTQIPTSQVKEAPTEDFTYIPPTLTADPNNIKLENVIIGNETFNSIMLSVSNAPIKITEITPSTTVDGLNIDQDCTERELIPANGSCIINIIWTPTKVENKNIFLLVKYNDPEGESAINDKNEKGKIRSFKINISLSSMEKPAPVVVEQKEPEVDEFFEEEEEEEYEEEPAPADEEEVDEFTEAIAPVMNQKEQRKRTIYPDDCKKYASKAYDFSGTFIGWVQSNNDVFSPNCTTVIGSLQEDGMVLETATGKIIGKGSVHDKKKSEEKRIELALPMLDEVMNSVESGNFNPNFEDVWNNRLLVKEDGYGGKNVDYDLYKADDPLNIIGKQKNELIPFSITDSSQISSMPKDERYVLRQAKPIPAVLNRPIYFGNINYGRPDSEVSDGTRYAEQTTAVATVERNVYGGDGRTIIIPSGSQLIGSAVAPGGTGLQEIEKISINWNRLIRPDGAEFDLGAVANYTGDAQGRQGVAGKNDTEYMRDLFVKPLLYSAIPVLMEAIFPSSSQFVTRTKRSDGTYQALETFIDEESENLFATDQTNYGWDPEDIQTIANMSSKDKMKLEIQQNWKTTMQKLIEQSAKTSIPFTVPAGTRIMIFLDKDIMLRIDENMDEAIGDSVYQHTDTIQAE